MGNSGELERRLGEELPKSSGAIGWCYIFRSWISPVLLLLMVCAVYGACSWKNNHLYLVYMEKNNITHRQDDVLIDFLQAHFDPSWSTQAGEWPSDTMMIVISSLAFASILLRRQVYLWTCIVGTVTWVFIFKTLVECPTIRLSAYGYHRCIDRMGITSSAEDTFHMPFQGSCSSMMFSGHTALTLICSQYLLVSLNVPLPQRFFFGRLHLVSILLGLLMMFLLLLNHGHYSADCIVSYFVVGLIFSTDFGDYMQTGCPFMSRMFTSLALGGPGPNNDRSFYAKPPLERMLSEATSIISCSDEESFSVLGFKDHVLCPA